MFVQSQIQIFQNTLNKSFLYVLLQTASTYRNLLGNCVNGLLEAANQKVTTVQFYHRK